MIEKGYRNPYHGDRSKQSTETGRLPIQPVRFLFSRLSAGVTPVSRKQIIHGVLHSATKPVAARRTAEADGSRHFCTRIFLRVAIGAKARLAFVPARAIVDQTPITAQPPQSRRTSWTAPQTPSGKAI
ncbi:hypothetical protein [Mesorhizobium muleiense]|uniref:hypothetical protein n=1 Tax=Mesorhizobium muleiense TaxID=1004279 RepID=UPI001F2DD80E|nr:hypothetical protein [Mesorhizobium muleiense]MCF6114691.1 hypothetical protein [Mesorhizobium muleiense]